MPALVATSNQTLPFSQPGGAPRSLRASLPECLRLVTMTEPPSWDATLSGMIIAGLPYVGGSLQVLVDDIRTRRTSRTVKTVAEIAAQVGERELMLTLARSPELEALFC